jgi:D-alanyl-D-alanine carboxypeptidase (penicillin-binding protein 5/6)
MICQHQRGWVSALVLVLSLCGHAHLQGTVHPSVKAESFALMDAETGVLLSEHAGYTSRPIASTTKVVTALLALEAGGLDEPVAAGRGVVGVGGARLGLRPGDIMTLDDLLAATLVSSANDCAFVIAEHIAGSVEAFAERMNRRAAELGAADTHFANPHGLHDADHYSSAHDLALLTREALKHERFREIVGSRFATVTFPRASNGRRTLRNHNKLLRRADFVDGVKTGYVSESGHCLVASGTRDDWQLIAVVLDSPDMYGDALRLLEYGHSSFRRSAYARSGEAVGRVRVQGGESASVPAVCRRPLHAVVGPELYDGYRLEVDLDPLAAPVEAGEVAGVARLLKDGRTIDKTFLLVAEDVGRSRLMVGGIWSLRAGVILLVAVLVVRTYAKVGKAHRSSRGDIPSQGGGLGPRGSRAR